MLKDRGIIFVIVIIASMMVSCGKERGKPDARAIEAYVEASASYQKGNFGAAIKFAKKALEISPDFHAASLLEGKALLFSGEGEEALVRFSATRLAEPGAVAAGIWRVRALRVLKRDAEARTALEELLALDGEDWRLLALAATMRDEAEDLAGARAFIDRAIESASGIGACYLERARFKYASGDAAGSLADLGAAKLVLPPGSTLGESATTLALRIKEKEGLQ